jgi:hypothetical protein
VTSTAFFQPEAPTLVRFCDPCAGFEDETEATATVRFVRAGDWFTMDVCPEHKKMWVAQFADWEQCATRLDHQPVTLTDELAATDEELYRAIGDPAARRHQLPAQPDPRRMRVVPPEPVIKTDVVIDRDGPDYDKPVKGEVPMKVIREWALTDHAQERMLQRRIPIQEVWRALHRARRADMVPDLDGGCRVIIGDLCVVVNPDEKVVLTVWRPSTDDEAAAAVAALGGRY